MPDLQMAFDGIVSRADADTELGKRVEAILRDAGLQGAARMPVVVALLSDAYLKSELCRNEARNAPTGDPVNEQGRLVALRIAECEPISPFDTIPIFDLVPLLGDANADAFAFAVRGAVSGALDLGAAHFAALFARVGGQIIHPEVRLDAAFAARESDLATIESALADGGNVVVCGRGGVGKTALVRAYAWLYRQRYAGVWWVHGHTREQIAADLVALGARLVADLDEMSDRQAATELALEKVARTSGKPWLLIYDDVEQPETLAGLLPASGAHVLVTSRTGAWEGHGVTVTLQALSRTHAVEYLQAHARKADPTAAAALADDVGCLPLALVLARSTAWSLGIDFDAYRALLRDAVVRAPKTGAFPPELFATVQLALERATALSPHAAGILGMTAYLAPDRIPLDVIAADTMTESTHTQAVAALRAVALLDSSGLDDGTLGVGVNRLVQAVIRARLWNVDEAQRLGGANPENIERTGEKKCIARAMRLLTDAYPREVGDFDDWLACQRLHEHACSIVNVAKRLSAPEITDTAVPLARRVLAIEEAAFGPGHPAVARHYAILAELLFASNRPAEADPYIRHAYLSAERSLGAAHADTTAYRASYDRVITAVEAMAKTDEAVEAGLAPAPPERLARPDIPPPLSPVAQRGLVRRILRRG